MPATDRPDMFDHLWRTAPREVWTERRAPADGAEEFATRFSVQGDGRVRRRRGEMLLDTARCATLCRVPAPYGPSPKRSNGVTRGAPSVRGSGRRPRPQRQQLARESVGPCRVGSQSRRRRRASRTPTRTGWSDAPHPRTSIGRSGCTPDRDVLPRVRWVRVLPSARCDPEDRVIRGDPTEVRLRRVRTDPAEEHADLKLPAREVGAEHRRLVGI